MDVSKAELMARELMNMHGLDAIPFRFNHRRTSFGVTRFGKKLLHCRIDTYGRERKVYGDWYLKAIELSAPLVALNSEADVRDTILHEIAHALTGCDQGHNALWQVMAIRVGAIPMPCCHENTIVVPAMYQALDCPCGRIHNFYRMPKRRKMCARTKQLLNITKVR